MEFQGAFTDMTDEELRRLAGEGFPYGRAEPGSAAWSNAQSANLEIERRVRTATTTV
jgi:hypothetical protein